jgi:hypothetical protein
MYSASSLARAPVPYSTTLLGFPGAGPVLAHGPVDVAGADARLRGEGEQKHEPAEEKLPGEEGYDEG